MSDPCLLYTNMCDGLLALFPCRHLTLIVIGVLGSCFKVKPNHLA